MAGNTCRIFVVDDHPAVREGLALLLEPHGITVCGDAESGVEALDRLEAAKPDLVLADLSLPHESGLLLIGRLCDRGVKVLVYSMHEDSIHIKQALAAGACGYVTKREGAHTLVEAIAEAMAGRRYLSDRVRTALADGALGQDAEEAKLSSLSERERLVLRGVGIGDSAEEIAQQLHISPRTVESYCGRMIEKLALGGMKELRRYAIQRHHEAANEDPQSA